MSRSLSLQFEWKIAILVMFIDGWFQQFLLSCCSFSYIWTCHLHCLVSSWICFYGIKHYLHFYAMWLRSVLKHIHALSMNQRLEVHEARVPSIKHGDGQFWHLWEKMVVCPLHWFFFCEIYITTSYFHSSFYWGGRSFSS